MPKAERFPFIEQKSITPDHRMLLDWLTDWESSTPETEYRTVSVEDYRFYSGIQDSDEVIQHLTDQKRPVSTYNEIKPKIDMLLGMAAQTRFEPTVVPVGVEDEPLAQLVQGVLAHYKKPKKTNLIRKELECFEHTTKSGRSLLYFYINKENPFSPQIRCKRIPGCNFVLDPQSTEYDMEDARGIFIDKWVTEEDIKAFWGNKVDVARVRNHTGQSVGQGYPLFFNEQDDLYRIVECWYRKWIKVRWFQNPLTGVVEYLTPKEFKKFEEALRNGIPIDESGQIFSVPEVPFEETMMRHVHYMIFTDVFEIESEPSPFKWKGFPAVLYGAYKNDYKNSWFGSITMMKDPQTALNTMRRQLSHLLQTLPKGLLQHEVGAILNIDEYEERSADPSFHLEIAKGMFEKVKFNAQPPISPLYQQFDAVMHQSIKDSGGIQDDLMGIQQTSREPGITVRMRQDAGFAVLYMLFQNFRDSRLESGRLLLSLVQQYVTEPEIVRIMGPEGQQLLAINTQMNPGVQGFNDVSAGEYDLEVDESLETTSIRMAIAQLLTEFSQNNPGAIPPDIILDYTNMPFTVKQRVRAAWEEQIKREEEAREQELAVELAKAGIKARTDVAKIKSQEKIAKEKPKPTTKSKGD